MNRFNQNLAKLQSGHHVKLREYMNLINPDLDGTCPHCRFRVSDELMTLKHWLCDWVAHAAMRQCGMRQCGMELGKHLRRLEWLVTETVIIFAWATLVPTQVTPDVPQGTAYR